MLDGNLGTKYLSRCILKHNLIKLCDLKINDMASELVELQRYVQTLICCDTCTGKVVAKMVCNSLRC